MNNKTLITDLKLVEGKLEGDTPTFYKVLYRIIQAHGGWLGVDITDIYTAIALQYPQHFDVVPNHPHGYYNNLVMIVIKGRFK